MITGARSSSNRGPVDIGKNTRAKPAPSQDHKIQSKTGIQNMKVAMPAKPNINIRPALKTHSTFGVKPKEPALVVGNVIKPKDLNKPPTFTAIGNTKKNPADLPPAGVRKTVEQQNPKKNAPTPVKDEVVKKGLFTDKPSDRIVRAGDPFKKVTKNS